MNIKEAKEYIKDTVRLYLKKDEFGEYRVPVVRQRPVFMLGAPGIGKTAVMEQIAQELGIALVSYSMTHHTRQSALGLPFITQKKYGDEEYSVSEYTMSEIIASVYETMEKSGVKEGILFLDEINCVSETLAPAMLQFLQYKTFGRHKVPDGWVIVTAGNPPEYNKSVREFDVVTMDRLKLLNVEPDLKIWKEYASERRLHGAVTSYLDLKKEHFYCMEMTTKGRSYVTARGWEDLSQIIYLYEEDGLTVEESLVEQYIRNDRIVREFTAYYELYNKYKKDYHIEEILEGRITDSVTQKAKAAAFDERLSLMGMLMDRVLTDMKEVVERAEYMTELKAPLKVVKAASETAGADRISAMLEMQAEGRRKLIASGQAAGSMSDADIRKNKHILAFLEERKKELDKNSAGDGREAFELVKTQYDISVRELKAQTEKAQSKLHNLFVFVEKAFEDGNEMLILVTELTVNSYSARFIASFGSEDYARHNSELMLSERGSDIQAQIKELNV
jgi:MoxR-like ATPase